MNVVYAGALLILVLSVTMLRIDSRSISVFPSNRGGGGPYQESSRGRGGYRPYPSTGKENYSRKGKDQ